MKVTGAVWSLLLVTTVYLGALTWVDARGGLLQTIPELLGVLGVLVFAAAVSWIARFCRWHWLMRRTGLSPPWPRAFLAYLAGFSFTATPGKVGELIRIRYFEPLGAPARLVIGLFVYERCLDLLVVLFLAMLALNHFERFWPAAAFALLVVAAVMAAVYRPQLIRPLAGGLARLRLRRLASGMSLLSEGISGARRWLTWTDLCLSLAWGLIAWGVIALSFCWLLGRLGGSAGELPMLTALAIYPLSMLAGAASMIPGGLGSTEAVIIALLVLNEVPVETATLAAVGARLSSLWAAILFGLVSLAISEALRERKAA
jgi:uncharacterized membrane protein YbhN (UPF0104 family)